MECYCVKRKKAKRRVLDFIVTGHHTINIPKIFSCSQFSEFDSNSIILVCGWYVATDHSD